MDRVEETFERGSARYPDAVPLNAELQRARAANHDATRIASEFVRTLRAGGRISAAQVQEATGPVLESIVRNADAFFWVSSLMRRESYLSSHAVNCCAMSVALGRHMGFEPERLAGLATGGLMLDLGMAQLRAGMIDAPGALDADARAAMHEHVPHGLRIMDEAGIADACAREMVRWHHERWDGSGYPDGLKGAQIPVVARMAAVIDSFDAMTSERAHQSPTSRHAALQQLYRGHETLYQLDVVEQFLQCMSIYPTGSLVELSTGQVGIVVAQNPARRLRPRVMLLLDAGKEAYARYPVIDLVAWNDANHDQPVDIVAIPEPGAYGLDPSALYLG